MAVLAEMIEMVLPQHTNTHGKLLGGLLVHWMDMVAVLAGKRHAHVPQVTAAIDFVNFYYSASIGDYIILRASLTRVFKTSMEIEVSCYLHHPIKGINEKLICRGYFVLVALGKNKRPVKIPQYEPLTPEQVAKWTAAGKRREYRKIFNEESVP